MKTKNYNHIFHFPGNNVPQLIHNVHYLYHMSLLSPSLYIFSMPSNLNGPRTRSACTKTPSTMPDSGATTYHNYCEAVIIIIIKFLFVAHTSSLTFISI